MKPEKSERSRQKLSSGVLLILLTSALVLLGALLTFVPDIDIRTLCVVFCVVLVAAGVADIVYFFATGAFWRMDDYTFAFGVLLLILGCCGFTQLDSLEASFLSLMGILLLIVGVAALQNTVQLRLTGSVFWIGALVFTVLILFFGVVVITNVKAVINALGYWLLIGGGALGLITMFVTGIFLRNAAKRPAEEAAPVQAPEAPESPVLQDFSENGQTEDFHF